MALPQILPSSSSLISHKTLLNPSNYILSQNPDKIFTTVHSLSHRHRQRRRPTSLRCSASLFSEKHHTNSPKFDDVVELPLFPLQLVLFPGAQIELQIFEFRYRIMMHTLLQTDLRFGVIYTDAATGTAEVGCVAEVFQYERLNDDRFKLKCKGQERFRVTKLVRTKPYLVAEVVWLEDRPSGQVEDLDALANEVEMYVKEVRRLSDRLVGKPHKEISELRGNLFPTPFSFYVGNAFQAALEEQQALLELEDTATRLKREKETLINTLKYLTALSAVKDVFPSA